MTKTKWIVKDYYDRPVHGDTVGVFDTYEDAKKEAKRYSIEDCDGECDIEIQKIEVVESNN